MNQMNQKASQWIQFVVIISLCSINESNAFSLPCEFYNSINITDGRRNYDGSITYDNITYTPNHFGVVNYIVKKTQHISVAEHIRGCICDIKKCIRLCCPYGQKYDSLNGGLECESHENNHNVIDSIQNENGQNRTITMKEHFGIIDGMPNCKSVYQEDKFVIKRNGDLLLENSTSYNHWEYCILHEVNDTSNNEKKSVLVCFNDNDYDQTRHRIMSYGMLLSIPFIIATFLVYFCVPELYHLHGKCLLCYLLALAIAYCVAAYLKLNGSDFISPGSCRMLGYTMYFTFLTAFLWLNVICFDLWFNVQATNGYQKFPDNKRFVYYVIYALGVPAFTIVITLLIDTSDWMPEKFKFRVGTSTCFLKNDFLGQVIYFYGPLAIILGLNVLFFILTSLKMRQIQNDMRRPSLEEKSQRHRMNLKSNIDKSTLYLRLFIVMGISWIMEVISFFVSIDSYFFFITDFINTIQGVIIFILLVLTPANLKVIKKRWQKFRGISQENIVTNGSLSSNLRLDQIE